MKKEYQKGNHTGEAQAGTKSARNSDLDDKYYVGLSQHKEESTFAYDEVFEDGFDLDTAERTRRREHIIGYEHIGEDEDREDMSSDHSSGDEENFEIESEVNDDSSSNSNQ